MIEADYFQPHVEEVHSHPAGEPAVAVDPTLIAARFIDIPVVAIESCTLEQEHFDAGCDAAFFRIGDQQYPPELVLRRVIAVIKFRSPVTIDSRCLMVRLNRTTNLASRQITLRIGLIDTLGSISSHKTGDQYLDVLQPYLTSSTTALPTYTVRVPLIYDQVIQPPQMPLIDRIPTKDQHVLHYTISIPAKIWPGGRMNTDFRIRVKVIQTIGFAHVVSISDSIIDTPRLQEAWGNFKDWIGSCCSRKSEQPVPESHQSLKDVTLDESPDQEYFAKSMSNAGPQTYSMPPPAVSPTGQNYFPYFPNSAPELHQYPTQPLQASQFSPQHPHMESKDLF